ncbi:MAG: CDP-alcohol phosphatidyltransferase family protein [Sedimentisphaerales bacterium]|nr:CDP-alcohol phosphatidyltransferase family protein [Sedimentisphaerales bacterium]
MEKKSFGGDKKLPMKSLLAKYERKLIDTNVSKFPKWIEGYHLTLLTIVWSLFLLLFGYLAKNNIHWLWASSVMVFLQWFTDSFDGALGRTRDTGIPRWGYYMDHFLDYIFICAVLVGYSFMLEAQSRQIVLFLVPVFGCFLVSSYLAFGATNEFKITFLGAGPTEVRIYIIVLNIALIIFGTAWIEKILPYILAASIILMCIVVFRTQKYIWNMDMAEKRARDNNQAEQ